MSCVFVSLTCSSLFRTRNDLCIQNLQASECSIAIATNAWLDGSARSSYCLQVQTGPDRDTECFRSQVIQYNNFTLSSQWFVDTGECVTAWWCHFFHSFTVKADRSATVTTVLYCTDCVKNLWFLFCCQNRFTSWHADVWTGRSC